LFGLKLDRIRKQRKNLIDDGTHYLSSFMLILANTRIRNPIRSKNKEDTDMMIISVPKRYSALYSGMFLLLGGIAVIWGELDARSSNWWIVVGIALLALAVFCFFAGWRKLQAFRIIDKLGEKQPDGKIMFSIERILRFLIANGNSKSAITTLIDYGFPKKDVVTAEGTTLGISSLVTLANKSIKE
jgi:hypothetical protein